MFFLTKLLAFLPGGNFLSSTLGKILIGAGLMLALWMGFNVWLSNHDDDIRNAARLEFNQEQILVLEEQRQEFTRRMMQLEASQADRIATLQSERDEAQAEAEELITSIRSGEFDGDEDAASPILQETIRQLQLRSTGN